MNNEQLGIIRNPGYGMRDFPGHPGLWFTVYTSESTASLQCFFGEDVEKILKDAGVYEVQALDGRACWVENNNGRGAVEFLRIAKI